MSDGLFWHVSKVDTEFRRMNQHVVRIAPNGERKTTSHLQFLGLLVQTLQSAGGEDSFLGAVEGYRTEFLPIAHE